jgi:GNAT superfamily N-acetyltransferase
VTACNEAAEPHTESQLPPMPNEAFDTDHLYDRMAATLVASWSRCAERTAEASMEFLPGAAAAVFPTGPERAVYNNTLLARGLDRSGAAEAASAIGGAYADAGIESFAIWVHESEEHAIAALNDRGLHVEESNRAMATTLGGLPLPRPELDVGPADLREHLRVAEALGAPEGLLAGVDPDDFEVLVARSDGQGAATVLAFDHGGDRGIFNLGTLPASRRRGLGTGLTTLLLHQAAESGCATASVQCSELAEGLFAALGFQDLGRFIEYVP